MSHQEVLLILFPIITAVLSSYLTYYFTIRSRKREAMIKFKEEKYSNLIIALQGFVGSTSSVDLKRNFFQEQYKSWLYSSDEVVIAVNKLIGLLIEERGKTPAPERGREVVGNIILEMRRDLLGSTKLTYKDFRYTDIINSSLVF